MPDIEIYTQPWCPFCERAMHVLTTKGVEFREIDAPPGSDTRREARERSGGRTSVPQIFIGGTLCWRLRRAFGTRSRRKVEFSPRRWMKIVGHPF